VSTQRTTIRAHARNDGLSLLKTINDTQAHGQEGARADPSRAAHQAGWMSAQSVTKMPWPISSGKPRC
jgi:hypothetical protein